MIAWTHIISVAIIALSAIDGVLGHMSMENPPARGAWDNKGYPVDYNLESPLNFAQFPGDLPCRHKDRGPIVATYNAGQMIDVSFKKINTHMGGHCQFGLSYDNKNFVVLKTVFERCFLDGLSFKVPLPSGAPAGNAVLSWSWVNSKGNREYYMNCADVKINGPANGSVTGQRVVVANMPNTPRIGEWVHNNGDNGRVHYVNSPVITIPGGAQSRNDGRVYDKF